MPSVIRDDCELWYDLVGSGPPLVLAAGLGGTAGWWAPQVKAWAGEFTLLTFDQRGTGRSTRSAVTGLPQLAADLAAIMDHAGIGPAQLLGHSTGAAIGVALALAEPARLRSLLIYASTTHGDPYRHRLFALRNLLHRLGGAEAHALMTSLLLYPPGWINAHADELPAREAASAAGLGPPEVQASRMDAILGFDPRAELHRLTLPVKLLWAADDILTPPYFMTEFADRIPQAEATLLPGGGHGLSQSEPAAFAAEVLPFLRRYAA